jgi:hypothetical protein
MGLKLITEICNEPMSLLTEADAKTGDKFFHLRGPCIVAGVLNKNRRMYNEGMMEKVVDKYTNDYIKQRRALGEIRHPSNRLSADFEHATHLIVGLEKNKNVWEMDAKILKTPMGKILEGLLTSGVAIGVSTRGAGSIVEKNGVNHVADDFVMTAIDAVTDPSGQFSGTDGNMQSCFVQGILEGVSFTMNEQGNFIQQNIAEIAKQDYDKKRLSEERKLQLFNKFISEIRGI